MDFSGKIFHNFRGWKTAFCHKYQEYICWWHVHFWRRKKCRGRARSCQANRRTLNEKVVRKLKRSSFLGAHCNTRWYEINLARREDEWKPIKSVWPYGYGTRLRIWGLQVRVLSRSILFVFNTQQGRAFEWVSLNGIASPQVKVQNSKTICAMVTCDIQKYLIRLWKTVWPHSTFPFFQNISTVTGLEPAIPRSEVWCLIH